MHYTLAMATSNRDEILPDFSKEEFAMATIATIGTGIKPRNMVEAKVSEDWPMWKEAMLEQLTHLKHNNTWTLVPHPTGKNIIGCCWVFRIKRDANGKIMSVTP